MLLDGHQRAHRLPGSRSEILSCSPSEVCHSESLSSNASSYIVGDTGERPLPSYLGGGDLDGDLYNVTTRRDLLPHTTYAPASYDPATKKLLDCECTMDDVADFVAEYISSDVSTPVNLSRTLFIKFPHRHRLSASSPLPG